MSKRRFRLVLVAKPFTRSLPARIQWLTRHKPLFFWYTRSKPLKLFLRRLLEILAIKHVSYSCTLKNFLLIRLLETSWEKVMRLINLVKQLIFKLFVFDIDLGNELALKQMGTIFLVCL